MKLIFALLIALCLAPCALAQDINGAISGSVKDNSGAVLPGAKVTATNLDTSVVFSTTTNDAGVYAFPLLPPGRYQVRVEANGFKAFLREGFTLGAGQTVAIDASLETGAVTDTVTVTAEAPILKTESAALSNNFARDKFENLPVNRSVTNILRVVPGVVPNPSGFSNGLADGNINGGRATTTEYSIDGTAASNTNLTQAQYQPILEAVEELTINVSNYGADQGRGGAAINITTRSGGNEFHGSLFHYFQNDVLNANGFFNNRNNARRPALRHNNFGGVISGPIWLPGKVFGPASYDGHNRSFFTFAYEGLQRKQFVQRTSTVPTLAMRNGDFTGLAQIFDPATTRRVGNATVRDSFLNNIIPASRIDPVAKAMLEFYPAPNRSGSANNYFYQLSAPTENNSINTRVDHNLTQAQRASVRYGWQSGSTVPLGNAPSFDGPAGAGSTANSSLAKTIFHNFSGSHTWTISPSVINNFSLGYFFTHTQQFVPGQGEGWAQRFGFNDVSRDQFPLVTLAGFQAFGGGNQSNIYPARNYDISDTVTWIKGRHSLKLGGNFRRLQFDDQRGTGVTFGFDSQGTFNTQTRAGGHSFASFLLGIPTTTGVTVREPSGFSFRYRYYAGFVQDDFRVNSKLTLNLGLRWETTTPRTEVKDLQTVFNLQTRQIDIAGKNGFPRTLRDADLNNFQPRVGFAWKPFEKTVVRGGYGIFLLPTDVTGNTFTDPGPAQTSRSTVADFINLIVPVTFRGGLVVPQLSNDITVSPTTNVSYMPRDFPNAYQQQWNLNVQRELVSSLVVEIGYVGTRGVHLEFSRNLNQIPINRLPAPAGTTLQSLRPYPTVNNIGTQRSDPIGSSTYHALQALVRKRLTAGFSFNVAYTFSKSIDDASDSVGFRQVGPIGPQNNYNLRAERAASNFDRTHVLSYDVVWQLPFGIGRKWMNANVAADAVLGGWNFGVIGTAYTGLPLAFTVNNPNAITNTLGGGLRPNRIGSGKLPDDQRSINRWFDAAAFAAPAANTFGNASRTFSDLRGPGFYNLDLLLAKDFRFTESVKLALRGELFNALNHFNPGMPNAQIGNVAVGTITSAQNAGRTVQLSLRLVY